MTKINNSQLLVDNRYNFIIGESYNYNGICLNSRMRKSSGETRQKQIDTFLSLFNVEEWKKGRSIYYKILSMKKLTNRELNIIASDGRGANGKFTDDLQNILLGVMSINPQEELNFSRTGLFKTLHMVNSNYTTNVRGIKRLSKMTEIDEDVCFEYIDNTKNRLEDYLETALKGLARRRLVEWSKVTMVCKITPLENIIGETRVYIDESDDESTKVGIHINRDFRPATDEETRAIMTIEKSVLRELGCNDTQEVFVNGKWSEYRNRVNELTMEAMNIQFNFKGYKLIYNHDDVMEELPEDSVINNSIRNINANIVTALKENAITRHANSAKTMEKVYRNEELYAFYTPKEIKQMIKNTGEKIDMLFNTKKHIVISSRDNYVEYSHKLTDTVVSKTGK